MAKSTMDVSDWVEVFEQALEHPLYALPATPAQQDAERFRQKALAMAAGARIERAAAAEAAKKQTAKATAEKMAQSEYGRRRAHEVRPGLEAELRAEAHGKKPSKPHLWRRISDYLAEEGCNLEPDTIRRYFTKPKQTK